MVLIKLTEEQAAAMGDLYRSVEYDIEGTPSDEAFNEIAKALREYRTKP